MQRAAHIEDELGDEKCDSQFDEWGYDPGNIFGCILKAHDFHQLYKKWAKLDWVRFDSMGAFQAIHWKPSKPFFGKY